MSGWREDLDGPYPGGPDDQQSEYRAAACGDPKCVEEHGDERPLAPWGGLAPQPKLASRRGLARAWFVRAAIVVLAVVLVVLLGWVDAFGATTGQPAGKNARLGDAGPALTSNSARHQAPVAEMLP